jgi:transaldolase/glucose-6-phosphate isomerase
MSNPLRALGDAGQAIWLDYLHRKILEDGELARLIRDDGLKGMTSNPSIFEKAIGEGDAYDDRLKSSLALRDGTPMDLYERLAIPDIQSAADHFRPLYDSLDGADGYVSLEVSPYLAMDTQATLEEARRLWGAVGRPNVMIKVPGTAPGVPAIRTLISEGININVTLLFGVEAYLAVAEAHLAGLEDRLAAGGEIGRVHGVASFFVSRIDTMIDKKIDERLARSDAQESEALKSLRGKVAIANAKIAYQRYLELVESSRWKALAAAGASPQRLLWASTGAKDPTYSDVLYVQTLIGRDTVNTMPPKTMDAFRDHGVVGPSLTQDVPGARRILDETRRLGLDLDGVTRKLVVDGVALFAQAFDKLLGAVADKRAQFLGDKLDRQAFSLPAILQGAVDATLERAAGEGWSRRLWAGDASLWTGADESGWLAWLAAGAGKVVDFAALEGLAGEVRAAGYSHALLMGMGGSSLAPEVIARTFGPAAGHPPLIVLDSTDPHQIARIEASIDPAKTLFIVSSKSGSTLEPDILHRYFFALAEKALGQGKAGAHFIAVTDPGSALEKTAREQGFAHIFFGDPGIGGRYSALSNFGMVPAAVLGRDVRTIFDIAAPMVSACDASAPPAANPGVRLGVVIGEAARSGRDKLTIIASPGIGAFGSWLEQLIAESTGKQGKGVIPIDGEALGAPKVYGEDRLFAFLRLEGEDQPELDEPVRALEEAGQPVVRITLARPATLAQEIFRWETAIATAGAVIGINPFDQPDVEASKVKARELTDEYEKTGKLRTRAADLCLGDLSLYATPGDSLAADAGPPTLDNWLRAHFERAASGGYIGLLAYLDRNDRHAAVLEKVRLKLRNWRKVATVLGFGPRFQHSTGQAYKGGPAGGVFLQITATSPRDLEIPGRRLSFGIVEAAQAQGDLAVLAERGRRVLRLDLGEDVEGGLDRLLEAVEASIG